MHKKKVDEVRDWLRKADVSLQLGLPPTPRLLVLSGPPGTGKSAMLRVLANELHFETCEWVEPRTVAWDPPPEDTQPHDPRIAAFAAFLRNALRTLSLCVTTSSDGAAGSGTSSSMNHGARRRLVVLDELAVVAGYSAHETSSPRERQIVRACSHTCPNEPRPAPRNSYPSARGVAPPGHRGACALAAPNRGARANHICWYGHGYGWVGAQALIRRLLPSAHFPIALVLSTDTSNSVHRLVEELKGTSPEAHHLISEIKVCRWRTSSLPLAFPCPPQAPAISCLRWRAAVRQVNPLADTFLLRTLQHVCSHERLQFSASELTGIVGSSGGDLRNAIHSLQLISTGLPRHTSKAKQPRASKGAGAGKRPHGGAVAAAGSGDGHESRPSAPGASSTERDRFPDMFHAIGSILHRPAKRAKLLASQPSTELAGHPAFAEQCDPQRGAIGVGNRTGDGSSSGADGAPRSVASRTARTDERSGDDGGVRYGTDLEGGSCLDEAPALVPHPLASVDASFAPEAVIEVGRPLPLGTGHRHSPHARRLHAPPCHDRCMSHPPTVMRRGHTHACVARRPLLWNLGRRQLSCTRTTSTRSWPSMT